MKDGAARRMPAPNMKLLEPIAKTLSILGGLLIVGVMLMTCYSLIGRNFFQSPLIGDFELTAIGCGMAMALFMPYCQLKRENIMVDFFTARMPASTNAKLDRMGSLLMTALYGVLGWRAGFGAVRAHEGEGASMLIGFPDWIVYACMCVGLSVAALMALAQVLGMVAEQEEHAA